jgi:hypothetical protein
MNLYFLSLPRVDRRDDLTNSLFPSSILPLSFPPIASLPWPPDPLPSSSTVRPVVPSRVVVVLVVVLLSNTAPEPSRVILFRPAFSTLPRRPFHFVFVFRFLSVLPSVSFWFNVTDCSPLDCCYILLIPDSLRQHHALFEPCHLCCPPKSALSLPLGSRPQPQRRPLFHVLHQLVLHPKLSFVTLDPPGRCIFVRPF